MQLAGVSRLARHPSAALSWLGGQIHTRLIVTLSFFPSLPLFTAFLPQYASDERDSNF